MYPVAVREDDIYHNRGKEEDNYTAIIIPRLFDFNHRRCASRASNSFLVFLGNKNKSDFIERLLSPLRVIHYPQSYVAYCTEIATQHAHRTLSSTDIHTDIHSNILFIRTLNIVVQVNQHCG